MTDDPASNPVSSSQTDIHSGLEKLLDRYQNSAWQQPIHGPTQEAFQTLESRLSADECQRLILDSGCGTGMSTDKLADQYPDHLIIGVDRSAERLSRVTGDQSCLRKDNAIWVRAELTSFWRLILASDWNIHKHYLLYPNPYPKPSQLQRRWHGHPVFRQMLGLSEILELRTNWTIYAREFAAVVEYIGGYAIDLEEWKTDDPLTLFEKKYQQSGHILYRVILHKTLGRNE